MAKFSDGLKALDITYDEFILSYAFNGSRLTLHEFIITEMNDEEFHQFADAMCKGGNND